MWIQKVYNYTFEHITCIQTLAYSNTGPFRSVIIMKDNSMKSLHAYHYNAIIIIMGIIMTLQGCYNYQ